MAKHQDYISNSVVLVAPLPHASQCKFYSKVADDQRCCVMHMLDKSWSANVPLLSNEVLFGPGDACVWH